MLQAFIPDSVITDGQKHVGVAVLTEGPLIKALVPYKEAPANAKKIKLEGLTLAPGLVDIQVNGGGGVLFNDNISVQGITDIVAAHKAYGTTTLLPTLISDDVEKMDAAIDAVATYRSAHGPGCAVAGLHLEGPFLNVSRKGIHAAEKITRPDLRFLKNPRLKDAGKILLTIAPEVFAEDDLAALHAAGIILSAGHSMANKDDLEKAKRYGLVGVTHLFNGMGGLSAREPGLAGLALADSSLRCSIIADGAHVCAEMVHIAINAKPPGGVFFVSDAMPPAGEKNKKDFILQGKKIYARNGRCEDENGKLAGSALTLFECVQVARFQMGIPLEHSLAMASAYPCSFLYAKEREAHWQSLNTDEKVGSLQSGHIANMIAFKVELNSLGFATKLNLEKVIVAGAVL